MDHRASEGVEPFDAIDQLLAEHPFGNTNYITEQLHISYKRRLEKISAHLPAARRLLDGLSQADRYGQDRTLGDTIVRCAIQHAHTQTETGTQYGIPLEDCGEIFRETARLLNEEAYGPLGHGLRNRLGSEPGLGWIWTEDRSDDVFSRSLRHVIDADYHGQLCTPDADDLEMLRVAARLLGRLLPRTARSALRHAHLVAIFPDTGSWAGKGSSSQFRIGGTIFISRKMLFNPWWVAEHLLHEALHQQMYDFRHGHTLLEPNFQRHGAPLVRSLWNMPDSNRWDVHRTLAAFHVYVHLALLAMVAEEREGAYAAEYGPKRMISSRTALGRAHYLREQLTSLCWDELGLAGKRFVEWFSSVLELLDPSPPPKDSYVHLLLDRYLLEARRVESLLRSGEPSADLTQQLDALSGEEMHSCREALAVVAAHADLSPSDNTSPTPLVDQPGMRFVRIRQTVVETVLGVFPHGYVSPDSKGASEILTVMIERSSEALKSVFMRSLAN
jgi:hypothetical protein